MVLFEINKQLNAFKAIPFKTLTCGYCESPVLSPTKDSAFCQFCGAYTEDAKTQEKPEDTAFHNGLAKIQSSIRGGALGDAKALSSTLFTKLTDPEKLFCGGNIYLFLSDQTYSSKDYAITGFMEKNSANVYESLDLTSKSKEFFYKTLWLIDASKPEEANERALFIAFLCCIYLKQHKKAKRHLDLLGSREKPTLIRRYADMIYSVETGSQNAKALIESLLGQKEVNTFFYMGKYLAKSKKLTEAEALLAAITSICKHPQAEELLNKIRNTEQALSLQ